MLPVLILRSAGTCPSDIIGKAITSVTHVSTSSDCAFTASYCLFQKIRGTAIYMKRDSSAIYVSDCTFQNCSNTDNSRVTGVGTGPYGGACLVQNLNSTITRCCGYKCYSKYGGQFYLFESTQYHFSTDISTFMCGNEAKNNGNN